MRRVALGLLLAFSVTPAFADFDALLAYARDGNLAALTAGLAAGDDPNPPDYHHGYAPLQFAAGNGEVEMTRALLAAGADTEYRDHNGDRALLWAAQNGEAATVALLLAAGSPADAAADPYGKTPLMASSAYSYDAVAKLLLAAGADPNRFDQTGETALHLGARSGNAALVTMLLQAGANPNALESILLETPLHEAATRGTPEVIRLLLAAGAAREPRNSDGNTPLMQAAAVAGAANIAALLAAGANPDAADFSGETPMLRALSPVVADLDGAETAMALLAEVTDDKDRAFATALWAGRTAIALRLLERGASPDAVDTTGRPALAGTVLQPGLTLFSMLLLRGADLDRFGPATLRAAAWHGRPDIARELLARGVAVDVRDEAGTTPFLQAAREGQVEMAKLLLDAGADPAALDFYGHGLEHYMAIVPDFLGEIIDTRGQSRAYRPTEHLELQIADLTKAHAAIRALLK